MLSAVESKLSSEGASAFVFFEVMSSFVKCIRPGTRLYARESRVCARTVQKECEIEAAANLSKSRMKVESVWPPSSRKCSAVLDIARFSVSAVE